MMGSGYWLNPRTGEYIEVNKHEKWISNKKNARHIGLSKRAYEEIKQLNPSEDIDEIRIIAIIDGLVRIRDYQSKVAIQFYAGRGQTRKVLWSVYEMMQNEPSLRNAWDLIIGNLKTKEDVSLPKDEFDKKMTSDEAIMMMENDNFERVSSLITVVESKLSHNYDERWINHEVIDRIESRMENEGIIDDNCRFSIVDEIDHKCNNLISEAGLSRLLRKFNSDVEFAIITAHRHKYGKKENIKRNRDLRSELNARHMGVYQLVGHWRECQDENIEYKDCPPDKLKDTVERSYMVVKPETMTSNEFEQLILDLVNKYEQDGAVIRQNNKIEIIEKSGDRFAIGERMSLGKIAQAYSQHVKKLNVPFTFEGVEIPSTNTGARIFQEYGVSYPTISNKDLMSTKEWCHLLIRS
ncbi:MAG: hypothetical protein GF411_14040 [Candidatus Lokiarchaeota archaeon]|nr:hypothetical protein [Candidatus Lokiarchaeota archaeon]